MAREVSRDEFAAAAADLLSAVAGGDETVVVVEDAAPVAVLTSHRSLSSLASIVDLPRWEEWLHEMKEAVPEAAARRMISG